MKKFIDGFFVIFISVQGQNLKSIKNSLQSSIDKNKEKLTKSVMLYGRLQKHL